MNRVLVTVGSTIFTLTLALLIIWQKGADWRIPADRLYPTAKEMRAMESALCKGSDKLHGVRLGSAPGDPIITCSHNVGSEQNIYVWGDSHARHLLAGLISSYPDHNIHILYYTSCPAQSGSNGFVSNFEGREALKQGCVERNAKAKALFAEAKPTAIILHQLFGYDGQFSPEWYAATEEIIELLEGAGHRVAFLGGVPRPGVAMADCVAVPAIISDAQLARRCKGNPTLSHTIVSRNTELSKRFPKNFVDLNGFFCTSPKSCYASRGTTLLFRDKHHLTVWGARMLLSHVQPRLSAVLNL